jgi:hypothetical protein
VEWQCVGNLLTFKLFQKSNELFLHVKMKVRKKPRTSLSKQKCRRGGVKEKAPIFRKEREKQSFICYSRAARLTPKKMNTGSSSMLRNFQCGDFEP